MDRLAQHTVQRLRMIGPSTTVSSTELRHAQIITRVRTQLDLSTSKLQEMQTYLLEEMLQGLTDEENANIKMLLSYVDRKETTDLNGSFYALDLGGTNFRVLKLTLRNGDIVKNSMKKFKIPTEYMTGTSDQLFGFIADSVASVADRNESAKLGFTFSFPMKQERINHGRLITWTKGFCTSGVEGKNVVELLQKEFDSRGIQLEIAALCNDTVGTLVREYFNDNKAQVGVILGTGSNACYWEKKKNIPKFQGEGANSEEAMAINMEWGAFDSGAVQRVLPITQFDREVDASSLNPGKQLYEKMISGMYVAKICASVFKHYAEQGILPELCARNLPFTGGDVSTCLRDSSHDLASIRELTNTKWKVSLIPFQCALVKDVCARMCLRAARLAAMGIATVVLKTNSQHGCTISIDGSLYSKTPGFPQQLKSAIDELLGPNQVECVLTNDGSGLGAGLIAGLVSLRSSL